MNAFINPGSIAKSHRSFIILCTILVALSALITVFSISLGPGDITFGSIIDHITGRAELHAVSSGIVWDLRLPRALLAFLIGAALGVAGVTTQGMFRNPLASPNVLGISSGASFFVVVGIALGVNETSIYITPFLASMGALFSIALLYLFSRGMKSFHALLLSGIALSTLLSACVTLVLSLKIQNYEVTVQIMNWLLGSLEAKTWHHLSWGLPGVTLGMLLMLTMARHFDTLNLGEETAYSLGVNVRKLYAISILAVAVLVGTATALSGIIGFVGLIVPHISRLLIGARHSRLVPFAAIFGGLFLLLVDILARNLTRVYLAPGVITSLLGAPMFIWLIKSSSRLK